MQHGWGFDSSCFRGWLPHLRENPDCKIKVQIPDRGYFGNQRAAEAFSENSELKIVLAHSLGLHLLPAEIISSADFLILAACFSKFHSGSELEIKRSQKTIGRMKKRLAESAEALLNDFYKNSYYPLPTKYFLLLPSFRGALNQELLEDDLELLDTNQFELSSISKAQKVLLLHGSEDRIVSPLHSQILAESLNASSIIEFEGAGHSLPLTHVAPVWISMRNKLRQFLTVNA